MLKGKFKLIFCLFFLFLVTCSDGDSPTEPAPVKPAANFTFTPSSGYAPLTVQFTSTSTGDISTYAWDFQNNLSQESSQRNPEYVYTEPGVYSVSLTVQGPGGQDTKIQENSITVLQLEAPIIEDLNISTDEDVAITFNLSGVDPQDLDLTFSITSDPQNGTIELNDNIASYTPNENWNGTETLTYIASNEYIDSNEGTISITVNPVDDEPNTQNISATTDEDNDISLVLNAEEYDGQSYVFNIVTSPTNGTTTFSNANTVIYSPNQDYYGQDSFTFEAVDSRNDITNVATASITINPINDAPVAKNVTVTTNEEKTFDNFDDGRDLFINDTFYDRSRSVNITLDATDVDSSNLTYSIVSQPSNGTLNSDGTNIVVYTPTQDWNGTDTFTYQASDGELDSNTATVTVNVNAVNDAPSTTDESITFTEDVNDSYTISITGASDPEGDSLTYTIVSESLSGTLSHDGSSNTVTFNANKDLSGNAGSFTYKVTDSGGLESNVSTVTISITNVNDAPVTTNISESGNEDIALNIALNATDGDNDSLTFSIVSNPTNGSTTLNGSVVTYSPDVNFNGTDSFTFKASDGSADSNISTVSLTISPVNDAPVAFDISGTVNENRAKTLQLQLDATDVDGDDLTFVIVTSNNGTISLNGSIATYTPNSNYNGTDTFTYKANDGTVDSNVATATITVTSVNDSPTTNDITISGDEDTVLQGTLDGTDIDGDDLTYSIVSQPSNGTATITSDGKTVQYDPDNNFNGSDTFTYKANDGIEDSNTSTVSVTVNAVNDNPTTSNGSLTTLEDTSAEVTLEVEDIDSSTVSASVVSQPSNGTVSITSGTFLATYTPNLNFNGTDSFTFIATDGLSFSNESTISIQVTAVNDAPVAEDVTGSTNENRMMQLDITLDASDVDGDDLTYSIVATNDGSVTVSGSTATYIPDSNFNGTDTFTYKANDGTVDSNTATATITVTAVNDAPVTSDQTASTDEDTALDITLSSTDVEGDSVTYSIVSDVSNGTTSLSGSTVTYTPTADYNGTDTFTFKANDGTDDSNTSTVTITIAAVNDAPSTDDITISGNEDTVLEGTLDGNDIDGDDLTYSIVSQPSNGTATITSDGITVQYDPDNNFNGTDSFTYNVNDGIELSNISTVSVTVIAVNDAPTINESSPATLNEDSNVDVTLSGTDIDGDTITFSVVTEPSNGSVALSGTNNEVATYTPTANYNGSDSFIYKANDGTADSDSATIFFTINAVNDAPVANDITVSTNENRMMQLSITLEGTDVDGDNLTYQIVESVSNGTLTDPSAGDTVTYTPGTNFNGTDTFTYKANDGTADSNTATVTITVNAVNDAPIALDITTSTNEDTSVDVTLDGSDVDGDSLTYSIVSDVSNGTTSISGSTLTYTPTTNYNGSDTFTYKANDGSEDSNTASVTITVDAVNDAPVTSDQTASTDEDTALDITLSSTDVEGDSVTYSIVSDVSNGTTSLSGSTVTYTPTADYNGTDTFTFKANDGTDDSNTSTVTITISEVSDAPVTIDQTASTDEDTAVDITLLSTDAEGDSVTYSIVSDASNGTTILTDASTSITGEAYVTYTPDTNYNGTDTFTFKANDGTDDSNTSTVTITIASVEDTPTTEDVSASTDEDTAVDITLDGSDGDGDDLTYSVVATNNGSVTISGSTATYTPDSNYNGTDTFTYKANDGDEDSNTSTVTVTVAAVNDAPTTDDDTASTDEDTAVDISITASDVEGDDVTFSIVSDVSNGTTSLTDSTVTYTPDANYNGTDTFTYKANDGEDDSNTSTITITITSVEDSPTTEDVSASTDEDTAVDITLDGSDGDSGDTLTYSIVSDVSNGTTSLSGSTVTYTPDENWSGTDTFTYKLNDGDEDSNSSTVTITVAAVNDAPVVEDITTSLNENRTSSNNISALNYVFVNLDDYTSDVDDNLTSMSYSVVTTASNGTVEQYGDTETGNTDDTEAYIKYIPDLDFNGTDTIVVKANDGETDSANATITITVNAVNDPVVVTGVASANTYSLFFDGKDSNSSTVSDLKVKIPTNSTFESLTDASIQIWINPEEVGNETMNVIDKGLGDESGTFGLTHWNDNKLYLHHYDGSYTDILVTNELSGSDWYHVVITRSGNDLSSDFNIYVNGALEDSNTYIGGIFDNDSDIQLASKNPKASDPFDGYMDELVFWNTALSAAEVSELYNSGDGLFAGSDSGNYSSSANLVAYYNMEEGSGGRVNDITSNNFDATIMTAGNDASSNVSWSTTVFSTTPTPSANSVSGTEDTDKTIDLSSYVTDNIEEESLTYSVVSDVSNGSTSVSGSIVTYSPNPNYNGTDTFTWIANDGTDDSAIGSVDIVVSAVNDLPTTDDQTASTDEDTAVDITLESTDPDTGDTITYSIVSDASNGTTSLSGSTVTYTPTSDYNGTDTFTFKANDGTGDSNTSTVTITVAAVNDAPVTSDQTASTDEDTAVDITLSSTDVEGDSVTYSIVSDVSNGTTSLSGSTVTYTPTANYNGTDTFTFKANDGTGDSNTSTVTITVAAVNDAPVTSDQTASTDEDTAVDITLSSTDVEGDSVTYSIVSDVSNGTTSLSGSTVTYTPTANYNGTDTFTFKANDGTGDSNTSTVTITVAAVNDLPTTDDISTTIDENRYASRMAGITLQGSDVDGDDLTYSVVSDASNGSTSISGATLTYTATQDWNGTETITYKANDGTGDSNTSTITITVTPINDVPVVVTAGNDSSDDLSYSFDGSDDHVEVPIDLDNYDLNTSNPGSLSGSDAGDIGLGSFTTSIWFKTDDLGNQHIYHQLGNTNSDGNQINFELKVGGTWVIHKLSANTGTQISYEHNGSITTGTWYNVVFVSEHGMQNQPSTGSQGDNVGQGYRLYINGTFVGSFFNNDAQFKPDQGLYLGQNIDGIHFDGSLDGFAIWDEDLTASEITEIYDQGRNYDLRQNTGNYASKANLKHFLDFSTLSNSKLDDRTGNSNQDASITGATAQTGTTSFTLNEDSSIVIALEGSDVEGDQLTYAIATSPTNGTATISGNRVTYTPDANYNGSDSFQWTASDGSLTSSAGTISLTISSVNDTPTTSAVNVSTDEDTAKAISLSGSDVDSGDTLTFSIVSDASNGSTSLSGSTVTYTPDTNWNGTDTFTYKANDGTVDSNTSTVTITVAAVHDGPTSADEGITVDEDGSVRTGFSSSVVDGDTITLYEIVSQPSNGTASIDMSNAQPGLYTPNANYNGTDSFTYRASDGTAWGNTATATVTISAVNDLPTTSDQTASTDEDNAVDITLTSSDVDTGDTITYSIVSDVSNGSTSLSGSTVTYTPTADYNGTDTFTFKANDGTGDSNTSTVTITVAAVNDLPVTANQSASTTENNNVDITLSSTDADTGDSITYSIVSDVSNGSTSLSGSTVTYTPTTDYTGTDTFTFKANDGTGDSNTSTVTITVNATPRYAASFASDGGFIVPTFEHYNNTSNVKRTAGTFSAWIYPTENHTGNIIARRDYASQDVNSTGGCSSGCERTHFQLWLNSDGSVAFHTNNENQQGFYAVSDTGVITANQWNHVVFTVNDPGCNNMSLTGTKQFYVNGSSVNTTVTKHSMNGNFSSDCGPYGTGVNGLFPRNTQLSVGKVYRDDNGNRVLGSGSEFLGGFEQFKGYIDELTHYDTVMSASDITTMYNSGNWFDHNSWDYVSNLYGWWHFDDQDLNNQTTNSGSEGDVWGNGTHNAEMSGGSATFISSSID